VGRLEGKVAVITGASSGIGRGVAEAFADEGAELLLVAHEADADDLTEAAGRLDGAAALVADVAEPETAGRTIDEAVRRFGQVDVLVNNAGFAFVEHTLEVTLDHWNRLMAVNLRGTFLLSQAFARYAVGRGGSGAIVNTASSNAIAPEPLLVTYNATKAAIVSLTRTMAIDLGRHAIRVNAVMPGMTRTRQTLDLLDDERFSSAYIRMIPLGRFAEPADIAPVYVFLASDDARYVTGASVLADGGLSAGLHWPDVAVSYSHERWESAS
jgi:NAD(P)-dependent dehydrogenase (short-subunit alcohol dehydrogenase family)